MKTQTMFLSPRLPIEHVYMRVVRRTMSSLSFEELQTEIGKRLAELREAVAYGVTPEQVCADAKERGVLNVSPRTMRDWEKGIGVPSLDKLHALLTFYHTTLGDFFRFTIDNEDGRLIADFAHVIRDPEKRKALVLLISVFRKQQ